MHLSFCKDNDFLTRFLHEKKIKRNATIRFLHYLATVGNNWRSCIVFGCALRMREIVPRTVSSHLWLTKYRSSPCTHGHCPTKRNGTVSCLKFVSALHAKKEVPVRIYGFQDLHRTAIIRKHFTFFIHHPTHSNVYPP